MTGHIKEPERRPDPETQAFLQRLEKRLRLKGRFRGSLPGWGRLQIDRELPFLCLYRRPPRRCDEGMERLIAGEASFLTIDGTAQGQRLLKSILSLVIAINGTPFGAFLIVECWSSQEEDLHGTSSLEAAPAFWIHARNHRQMMSTTLTLNQSLKAIRMRKQSAEVAIQFKNRPHSASGLAKYAPPTGQGFPPVHTLGIQVRPIFRGPDEDGDEILFPLILRKLRKWFSHALRKGLFRFTESCTAKRPRHYQALGPRALTRLVWKVDRRLSEISSCFDYLFQVTPVNAHRAWLDFQKSGFQRRPEYFYRPLSHDPSELKLRLFQIPVSQVEDPALAQIYREKQDELDRLITLMCDINTGRFLHGSIQIFGGVNEQLLALAEEILMTVSPHTRSRDARPVTVTQLKGRVLEEIRHYRGLHREFNPSVQVRDDLPGGVLVSRGEIYIGTKTQMPANRLNALVQHEVGVHLVTRHNGGAQPFRLLQYGLAGYEALQEGLAILAEYLVGGLTPVRLRTLAARVVAVRALIQGAEFQETFRLLHKTYRLPQQLAFQVAMRVHRGGGLTKDAIYLRGLEQVLQYLGSGHELEPLWSGKMALSHLPIIQELRWRKVIEPPLLIPRFMHELSTKERMAQLKKNISVTALLEQ